jgi:hypothetical protein
MAQYFGLWFYIKDQFMARKKIDGQDNMQSGRHEHPLPREISNSERQDAQRAHDEAEKDMEEDAELTASSPNDDLDEGETARLGENTDLV